MKQVQGYACRSTRSGQTVVAEDRKGGTTPRGSAQRSALGNLAQLARSCPFKLIPVSRNAPVAQVDGSIKRRRYEVGTSGCTLGQQNGVGRGSLREVRGRGRAGREGGRADSRQGAG